VEAMDAKGLAKAMESLIVNTLNLSQYSRNSYQMVKNEYSLELITKEYLNALN
jgi:glycosyltransferase involved in cell wall biosynthesis